MIRKSGPHFSKVMDYMQKLGLPKLASDYKDLSARLMEHERSRYIRDAENFRAQWPAQGPATLTPMPMPMPASSDLIFPDPYSIIDADSPDDGDSSAPRAGGPGDSLFDSDEDGFLHLE